MEARPEAPCPLCGNTVFPDGRAWGRGIRRCGICDLRSVAPDHWLSPAQEVARYQLHRNRLDDAGYVRFLMPVIDCLKRHGVEGRVLDYGCGPEPVLTELLKGAGFDASGCDPNFAGGAGGSGGGALPVQGFDAVVSTEVFEHFRAPASEMDRLVSLLRPGGLLVVMTALVTEATRMESWHYANDATHIVFYTEATFRYLADRWGFRLVECSGNRLVGLRRTAIG